MKTLHVVLNVVHVTLLIVSLLASTYAIIIRLGAAGPKGDTGATGPKGDTGAQGLQGAIGPKGDKGDTGPQGLQGLAGASGIVFPGAPSITNETLMEIVNKAQKWFNTTALPYILGHYHESFVSPTTAADAVFSLHDVQAFTTGHNIMTYLILAFGVEGTGAWILILIGYNFSTPETFYFMVGAVYMYNKNICLNSPEIPVTV